MTGSHELSHTVYESLREAITTGLLLPEPDAKQQQFEVIARLLCIDISGVTYTCAGGTQAQNTISASVEETTR